MTFIDEILETYQRLAANLPADEDALFVEALPGFAWASLGVKHDAVVLLLPPDDGRAGPEHDLEHIWVSPNTTYKIVDSAGTRTQTVAVISTKSNEAWLVNAFLELVAMLFESGVSSDPDSVRKLVQDLIALFRALTQPGKKSLQGLWGELFLIDQSENIELAVKSWHTTPNDRYDFARAHERVEVKSTTGPRIHTFAHAQLAPVPGLQLTVASLVLNPDGDGCTCADLVAKILVKLNNDVLKRGFVDQVVRTLGASWQNQSGVRFDVDQAKQGLKFFDVEAVPRITSPIPPNVLGVTYQSDLQVAADFSRNSLDSKHVLTRTLFCV